MAETTQLDILRDSPATLAKAYRQAAETALHDPYFTEEERRTRHAYYMAEARKLSEGIPNG